MTDRSIKEVLEDMSVSKAEMWSRLERAITCGYCGQGTRVDSGHQCSCGRILCPECGNQWSWCKDHIPMCYQHDLVPMNRNQPKPDPEALIGRCRHNMTCPTCGFGWGTSPDPCDPVPDLAASGRASDELMLDATC